MKSSMNEPVSTTAKNDGRIRLFIHALALSPVGTMGGNSKIAIEIARHLAAEFDVHFIVPASRAPNVPTEGIRLHTLPDFRGNDKYRPLASSRHYLPLVRSVFSECGISREDIVFAMSDFHVDVVPLVRLRKEFDFTYIASAFLFVPSLLENLKKGYGFPVFKYIACYIYSHWLFNLALRKADGFVVTNSSDFHHFPERFSGRLLDIYGGVNLEQIEQADALPIPPRHDVVFCSRLHPQKGIGKFLDIWKTVSSRLPCARLGVIGSGDARYERKLKEKAKRLGLVDTIDWLGYVNNAEKYAIYKRARVFVHPTVYDNNGMVAAEALCTGLPVVMFDLPSLRHVYREGCTKIPERDQAAFAETLVDLLSNESHRRAAMPTDQEREAICRQWDWAARCKAFSNFVLGVRRLSICDDLER